MKTFDAQMALADIASRESELLECSVVITGTPADLLSDLADVFISLN